MKKLMIAPAVILLASLAVHAQNNTMSTIDKKEAKAEKKEARKELRRSGDGDAGVLVKDHFYRDFGDIDASWKKTASFEEGSFVLNGRPMTAFYDADAELIGTTTPADFAELPESAQAEITKRYKGYTIGKVILFDDNEANGSDMILYGSAVSNEDNYFVELSNMQKTIVLEVNMEGTVSFFLEKK